MVVHPQHYAVGNPTPEPPVRRWRVERRQPLHLRAAAPRMRVRAATARAVTPSPPFDFVNTPLSARVGKPPAFDAAAAADAASQHTQESPRRVPCADEVAGERGAAALFGCSLLPFRIAKRPAPPTYDYTTKHRTAGGAPAQQQGRADTTAVRPIPPVGAEAADTMEPQRAAVKTLVAALGSDELLHSGNGVAGKTRAFRRRTEQERMRAIAGEDLQRAITREMASDAARPPPFRLTGLAGIPSVSATAAQAELERDVAQDELLVKMRRNIQAELRRRAAVALRRAEMRQSMRRAIATHFTDGLRLGHPHAVSRAQQIVEDEWRQLDLARLKEDLMGPEYFGPGHDEIESDDELLYAHLSSVEAPKPRPPSAKDRSRPAADPLPSQQEGPASARLVRCVSAALRASHAEPAAESQAAPPPACRPTSARLVSKESRAIVRERQRRRAAGEAAAPLRLSCAAGGEALLESQAFLTQEVDLVERKLQQQQQP